MLIKRLLIIIFVGILLPFFLLLYLLVQGKSSLIVYGVFLVLTGTVIVFFIMKKMIINPIMEIYDGVNFFKNGIFDHRIPVKKNDEIGELARMFNEMADTVDQSYVNLESIVKVRSDELMQQKGLSDAIVSSVKSGIMVLNPDGYIQKINPAGARILNLDVEEMSGKKLTDIYPESGPMLVFDNEVAQEVELTLSGGNRVPIGYTNSPLPAKFKDKKEIIVVFKDLTEIKQLQAELRRKQRFEAMGKVIAGVAHEIRNPLFGISSSAQILEREISSEKYQGLFRAMLKEVARLNNIVNELLFYSRESKLEIADIDIDEFVRQFQHYIKSKKDDIVLNLDTKPHTMVEADHEKLAQVFLNIINNAIDAGCKTIDIASRRSDDRAYITVKNDGAAISQKDVERIFDPFFTTKKEGTGLGLAICKKIIEDHGGEVEIFSSEREGTVFTITLKPSSQE